MSKNIYDIILDFNREFDVMPFTNQREEIIATYITEKNYDLNRVEKFFNKLIINLSPNESISVKSFIKEIESYMNN